jgi:hypothetical protein
MMVTLDPPSWNQLYTWLRELDSVRRSAAGYVPEMESHGLTCNLPHQSIVERSWLLGQSEK